MKNIHEMKEEKKKKLSDDGSIGATAPKKKRMDDSPSSTPHNSVSSTSSTSSQASGGNASFPILTANPPSSASSRSGTVRTSGSDATVPLSSDKKISKRNATGETMLILMAKKGDMAAVKSLVKGGANLNEQDYAGWTALHESCIRNFPQIANYLLRQGANVQLRGLHGDTALHDASRHGFLDVVRILMKYGADPYLANDKGERPIDVANSDEILKLLKQSSPSKSTGKIGTEDSDQSDSDSDLSSHTFTDETADNSDSKRVKDPYAFEDEEPDDSRSLTSPIKLRINKDSGQYAVQSSSSGGSTDLALSSSQKEDALQDEITASTASLAKEEKNETDSLPKLEEEENQPIMEQELNVTKPTATNSSDETSSKDGSSPNQTKSEDASEGNDATSNDLLKQKVPPLRIKLASENEKGKEGDTNLPMESNPPTHQDFFFTGPSNSPTLSETNGQNQVCMTSSVGTGNSMHEQGALQTVSLTDSSAIVYGDKDKENDGATMGFKQDDMPSTSERKTKSGRTLRSHTAAQREKEEKEKVDSAPIKKRKVRSRPDGSLGIHESASTSNMIPGPSAAISDNVGGIGLVAPAGQHSSAGKDKQLKNDPPENPFEKAQQFNKQVDELIGRLVEIQPKAPNGYCDYLMVTHDYLLAANGKSIFKKRPVPKDLIDRREQAELFSLQEEERLKLALRHQSEREHLRLCAEQEVIRSQNKAALAIATKNRPFSFCSVINYQDHTYIDQVKAMDATSKEEESVRDRFTSRTFIGWLKDTKDKFDNEKRKLLCRQLHESESLMMVQKLDWEMKLKELLIDDYRGDNIFRNIPLDHVPLVDVPNDFILFKQDPCPS